MGSTHASRVKPAAADQATPAVVRWRSWPLVEGRRKSWCIVAAVAAAIATAAYWSGSWLTAFVGAFGLSATLWQFFVPVEYEIAATGLRRTALGRTRHIPWLAIRACQFRPTGVVLYQRHDPGRIDLLRSLFVPYPRDTGAADDALRRALANTIELPP